MKEKKKGEKEEERGNGRKRNGMEGKEESEGNLGHGTLDINFFPLFSSPSFFSLLLPSLFFFPFSSVPSCSNDEKREESHLRCEKKMRK